MSGSERNKPCTCGSGVKYKKCCRDKPFHGPIQQIVKRSGSNRGKVGLLAILALASMETGNPIVFKD